MVMIPENTLSSCINIAGLVPDLKFFQEAGSTIGEWLKKPMASASHLVGKMLSGAKEVAASILNGSFFRNFGQWAQDDPVGAAAGVAVGGLALGVILITGGAAVGWIVGSAGLLAGGFAAVNALTGGSLGGIASSVMNAAEQIYSFNWQISDDDLMAEINSAIDALYEPAGEFLGRSCVALLVGGATKPAGVKVNIRTLARLYVIHPESRSDILAGVSELCYLGCQTAISIGIKYAFLHGRRAIKNLYKTHKQIIDKIAPGIGKNIEGWGEKGREPWSIESAVEEKIESIGNDRIENAIEGFLSGFWQQFQQSVEYVYN
jgi:hypothetical protein